MRLSKSTIERLANKYHEWVLVTGATSGIGKELAIKFAEAGFKLIITGRRKSELEKLSTYLFDKFGAESTLINSDLSQMSNVESLLKEIGHLNIGIAVLNAGFGTSGKFINSDLEKEVNMLELNCKSVLVMTHNFAKKMKEQEKKGAIVLLSSMVAFQGVPYAANYAVTKAYVQSLGEALSVELKKDGVDVLTAAPGPVASGFADRANMRMNMSIKPNDVGVPILKAIGKTSRVLPGFLTKFLVYNLRMTPRWAKTLIMGNVMDGFTKHQN